jgi:hypothetical protein
VYAHLDQLRVAADGVERRAQLVAHGREEVGLRAVRRLRLLARAHGRAVERGVVDGERGARRQLLRERELRVAVAPPRLGGHEAHRAEHVAARDERHGERRGEADLAQDAQVLLVLRGGHEQRVRDVGEQDRLPRPHHLVRAGPRLGIAG